MKDIRLILIDLQDRYGDLVDQKIKDICSAKGHGADDSYGNCVYCGEELPYEKA